MSKVISFQVVSAECSRGIVDRIFARYTDSIEIFTNLKPSVSVADVFYAAAR
jgi:hypothetical protein